MCVCELRAGGDVAGSRGTRDCRMLSSEAGACLAAEDWEEYVDEDGDIFYHDTKTNRSIYEHLLHCLSLTFHCLSLTIRCLSLTFCCLSLTIRCLSLTFRCLSLIIRCLFTALGRHTSILAMITIDGCTTV